MRAAKHMAQLNGVKIAEILGWKNEGNTTVEQRASWIEDFHRARGFIIGGGGLLEIDFFSLALNYVFENNLPKKPIVLWGAGHNNWTIGDWRKLKQGLDLSGLPFDLVGIRDYGHKYRWVPCASCLSPVLNKPTAAIHEYVVYLHRRTEGEALPIIFCLRNFLGSITTLNLPMSLRFFLLEKLF